MSTLIKTKESSSSYPFLRVYKEKEAFTLGINLTNKYLNEVYKYIQKQSTPRNAGRSALFSLLNQSHTNTLKIKSVELTAMLSKLMADNLITQAVGVEFDHDKKTIRTVPYFITHPTIEVNSTVEVVFDELIMFSVNSLKKWLEHRDIKTKEEFKAELETQFHHNEDLGKFEFKSGTINLLKIFQNTNYDLPINKELIEYSVKEIVNELSNNDNMLDLKELGIILLKEEEILPLFEACEEVLSKKIVSAQKKEDRLSPKLKRIKIEEMNYYTSEKPVPRTTEFTMKKAIEIKNEKMLIDPHIDSYPGSLTIEILVNIEQVVEKKFANQWKDESFNLIIKFVSDILDYNSDISKALHIVEKNEFYKYPSDVWEELINHRDLLHSVWQQPTETVHIFVGRHQRYIKRLIQELCEKPSSIELWKSQALKYLIENNEPRIKLLFSDKHFMEDYGLFLKNLYMNYMPWYQKLMLFLPLNFLTDKYFLKAKDYVEQQQQNLFSENEERLKEFIVQKEKQKQEKIQEQLDEFGFESIIEKLDNFYFIDKIIPCVDHVMKSINDLEYEDFSRIIQKKNFRTIPHNPKVPNAELDILLYPIDSNWSLRKTKIQEIINKILADTTAEVVSETDKLNTQKARRLKFFFDKSNSNETNAIKSKPVDPFTKFEKELKNVKARESKSQPAISMDTISPKITTITPSTEVTKKVGQTG